MWFRLHVFKNVNYCIFRGFMTRYLVFLYKTLQSKIRWTNNNSRMHLHVTLNRIVMLHNFVTPNILSHVPKIIQNIQKYTPTAFQITRMKYFANGFISNGPFNHFFAQVQSISLFFSTGHTASSVSSLEQTPQQPKSM